MSDEPFEDKQFFKKTVGQQGAPLQYIIKPPSVPYCKM